MLTPQIYQGAKKLDGLYPRTPYDAMRIKSTQRLCALQTRKQVFLTSLSKETFLHDRWLCTQRMMCLHCGFIEGHGCVCNSEGGETCCVCPRVKMNVYERQRLTRWSGGDTEAEIRRSEDDGSLTATELWGQGFCARFQVPIEYR